MHACRYVTAYCILAYLKYVHTMIVPTQSFSQCRPVGRGGVRGGSLLASKRFYIHRLAVHLSPLPFEGGPLVSLLLRITAVQTGLELCELFVRGRLAAERAHKLFTPLR